MNTTITNLVKALEPFAAFAELLNIGNLRRAAEALDRAKQLDLDGVRMVTLDDYPKPSEKGIFIPLRPITNADEHEINMTTNDDTPKPKLTFEQMDDLMKPYLRYVDQVIVHKATATKYRVVHIEFIESTMALHFSYYPIGNCYIVFSRPVTELTHERYEFPDDSKPKEPPPPPPDVRGTSFKDGWPRRVIKE